MAEGAQFLHAPGGFGADDGADAGGLAVILFDPGRIDIATGAVEEERGSVADDLAHGFEGIPGVVGAELHVRVVEDGAVAGEVYY